MASALEASAVSTTQTNANTSVKADLLAYYGVVRHPVNRFVSAHLHLVMSLMQQADTCGGGVLLKDGAPAILDQNIETQRRFYSQ